MVLIDGDGRRWAHGVSRNRDHWRNIVRVSFIEHHRDRGWVGTIACRHRQGLTIGQLFKVIGHGGDARRGEADLTGTVDCKPWRRATRITRTDAVGQVVAVCIGCRRRAQHRASQLVFWIVDAEGWQAAERRVGTRKDRCIVIVGDGSRAKIGRKGRERSNVYAADRRIRNLQGHSLIRIDDRVVCRD